MLTQLLRTHGTRVDAPRGVHFLLPFQHCSYVPLAFSGVRQALMRMVDPSELTREDPRAPYFEKDAMRWFSIDECVRATRNERDSPYVLRAGFIADFELLRMVLEKL